ncbi:MAG: response regulator [Candidatus Cloacimonadota bacterium]|nr:MAG: response regulator [Candidatus Cloacimonadota bacterium]
MSAKILVVDDEKDILELVSIILAEEHITVLKAQDGLTALELARKDKPDLILLDIMMPEIDGWEVLKILKIEEETKDIPVAMLTCKTETRDKVLGIQEGAADYITKPFAPEDLIMRVRDILSKKG